MYVNLSNLPSPPKKYQIALGALYGGLNTSKIPSEISNVQSPELLNVLWKDGLLRSRNGQEVLQKNNTDEWSAFEQYNTPLAMYERVWHDRLFAAVAHDENEEAAIIAYDLRSGTYETIYTISEQGDQLVGWLGNSGSFFVFGEKLFYKNKNAYVQIEYVPKDGVADEYIKASNVDAYIPVIMINTNANGVGDLYQPENRIGPWKEVWYNLESGLVYEEFPGDGTTTLFHLANRQNERPQNGDLREVVQVYIGAKLGVENVDYTVNLPAGTITLEEAPAIGLKVTVTELLQSFVYHLPVDDIDKIDDIPQLKVWVKNSFSGEYDEYRYESGTNFIDDGMQFKYSNGMITFNPAKNVGGNEAYKFDANVRNRFIKVQYSKTNADAKKSIDDCCIATTFGAGGIENNCIVMAGSEAQPNAFFWSGNDENGANPAYFPIEQYNLVGDYDDPITAFGRQQNKLVVFQKRRVSSAAYNFEALDNRLVVSLNVITVNDKIGCDVPNSVQLLENNLVWANTKYGVMYLKDSTYAYETLVVGISGNINDDSKVCTQKGLLTCLKNYKTVSSFDDGSRYWLVVDSNAFVLDYSLNISVAHTEKLCWYYMDGIAAMSWAQDGDDIYGLSKEFAQEDKWFVKFVDERTDFGKPFSKTIRTQTQVFGSFEALKNVESIVLTMNSAERVCAEIEYITDYYVRKDETRLDSNFETNKTNGLNPFCVRTRRPKCLHIHQFAIRLFNEDAYDLNLISAQIFYTFYGNRIKAGQRM